MQKPVVFKIIILGQSGVGKSSAMIRYLKGQFSQNYNVTVGVQFASKQVQVQPNKNITLQIWDTAGQEVFKAVVRSFYKGISGIFLAFALDSQDTLQSVKTWHKQVKQNAHEQVMFFLVGMRADLKRQVTTQKAQQLCLQIGAEFFMQTSAKTGHNIQKVSQLLKKLFQKAGQCMYKKFGANNFYRDVIIPHTIKRSASTVSRITLQKKKSSNDKKKGCCN